MKQQPRGRNKVGQQQQFVHPVSVVDGDVGQIYPPPGLETYAMAAGTPLPIMGNPQGMHALNNGAPITPYQNNHIMQDNQPPQPRPAQNGASALPSKTPVSVLQELLSRRGTTPKYELVQIEGAIHEPTFRYRVTVGEVIAVGTGRSKKEAKHAAAKAILDKLVGLSDSALPGGGPPSNIPDVTSQIVSPFDDKIPGNPIGTLQEMCMSRRWPPPVYDLKSEKGLPHERLFTIACCVFKNVETGTGKSKKLAKRQAAHKMWLKLKDMPVEQPNASVGLEDDDENTSLVSDSNFNYIKFLQEISHEQQFEVTFVDIEEKAKSGAVQCLVQLSTLPVAVCYGSGPTPKDAQSAAARNALEYLKIMTKK
ncbi:interferon-inducible double-stranded RNA-dependent protein kinase activator A homolog isoform X3 [Neocloeon triangulifer]|uniref:interferon-inducible double-stranded RNA-dependent protein kinase activator A homolog isoform X3 n=1 Tax=Neocloeon triangulifer TaxID=2078957 RepID=UPI00286F9CA7|nr:interferon-inducible double-stranded RNA-dependent protein kinase activator A homolog isoform X3 [Neocloeon triangulifer]